MNEGFDEALQLQLKALTERLKSIETKIGFTQELESINDWIDEESAKRITGLGKSTLYALRKSGKLTFSRLSKRKLFYRISDLSRLLDDNEKA
ncbi:MAG: hypothetical protein ACJASQ_001609 [Crocinitomicaceae bacterium]|jgi:hypothetical protein